MREPDGAYTRTRRGILAKPDHQRKMMRLWKRSGLVCFSEWDPYNERGERVGPRWDAHYRTVIAKAVTRERLTRDEANQLLKFLEILGT